MHAHRVILMGIIFVCIYTYCLFGRRSRICFSYPKYTKHLKITGSKIATTIKAYANKKIVKSTKIAPSGGKKPHYHGEVVAH